MTNADAAPTNSLTLWYEQPATKWEQALPIGNGRLGVMIFGGGYQYAVIIEGAKVVVE